MYSFHNLLRILHQLSLYNLLLCCSFVELKTDQVLTEAALKAEKKNFNEQKKNIKLDNLHIRRLEIIIRNLQAQQDKLKSKAKPSAQSLEGNEKAFYICWRCL